MDSNACIKFKLLFCLFSCSKSYEDYDTFAVTLGKPNGNFVEKFSVFITEDRYTRDGIDLIFFFLQC